MRAHEFDQPKAAGCVLYAEDTGRWGFQQRSDSVSDPGVWSTWGGGREPGETLEQCVRRELAEEGGYYGPIRLIPMIVNTNYATYIGIVPREFEPKVNSEVKDWCWVNRDQLPRPMYPGLAQALTQSLIKQELQESISPVVYHYTTIGPALKILQSGEFGLSSVLGSVEQQYAPKGYPYFLSTTRTRRGGYHSTVGSTGVLFVLDGTWFNQRYPGGSIDYWLNRNPQQSHHREHEAEDRVFSRDATIPITGVTGLHVYITPDAYPDQLAQARQLLIAAKRLGIDTKLYRDETAWRNFDTRNTADVGQLRGQERTGGRISTHPGYLLPWIQLLTAKDKSQLNKDADKIRYSLAYTYNREDAARGLSTDLSNARKPNSGPDREHAVKIIQFMRKNNLGTVKDLVAALAQKWQPEDKKVEENFADGKIKGKSRPGRVKRAGASCDGSVTDLRQRAKNASGERAKMYHWCANMKSGRRKNK